MASSSVLVDSLVEFYEVPEIRAFWKKAFDHRMSRSTEPVQITQSSFGGDNASGIVLSNPAEIDAFIAACKQAIRIKGDDSTTPASDLGSMVDFSQRPVAI